MIIKLLVFPQQLGGVSMGLFFRCTSNEMFTRVSLKTNPHAIFYSLYYSADRKTWREVGLSHTGHFAILATSQNLAIYLKNYFDIYCKESAEQMWLDDSAGRLGRTVELQTGTRSPAEVFECLPRHFLLCPHEWFLFIWHMRVESEVRGQSSIYFIPCSLQQDTIERAGMHAVFHRLIRQTSQHLRMKKHRGTFTITAPRLKLIMVKNSSLRSPVPTETQCHAQGHLNFQTAGARDQTFTSFTSLTQPLIPLSFRCPWSPQPMLKRSFFPNLVPCAVDSSWVGRSHESRQEPFFGPQFILKGLSE